MVRSNQHSIMTQVANATMSMAPARQAVMIVDNQDNTIL